ncbi:MAG: hypothetical protein L6Q93_16070 [Phycisphaerae bacterium]|nr:hypothetical protein [Phycisphaerae bacterium]NUQ10602.1 hypothetical protein [Phycisphaerae bacterium]
MTDRMQRFDGAVYEEANADIGRNRKGQDVVRLDLIYDPKGTQRVQYTLVLALDAAIALRNHLDGLFAAAGIDDGGPAGDAPTDDGLVDADDACPHCGERRQDALVWNDDARLICSTCRLVYDPDAARTPTPPTE